MGACSQTLPPPVAQPAGAPMKISVLGPGESAEVLGFLERRPIHTVYLAGLICDNGLVSPLNRGKFYSCRNREGALEGIALIGQKTVIEASTDDAFDEFTRLVSEGPCPHLIRGERAPIKRLLNHLSLKSCAPRLVCSESLLEQTSPAEGIEAVPDLRKAVPADLDQVVSINGMMAFEENGVNPLATDAEGVSQRIARRIEQGREWVLIENGRIVFKADIVSETGTVAFLEGIYVHPESRGRGYAFRCLTQLARTLLREKRSLCLVVNDGNRRARALYLKVGYQLRSRYRTVYF